MIRRSRRDFLKAATLALAGVGLAKPKVDPLADELRGFATATNPDVWKGSDPLVPTAYVDGSLGNCALLNFRKTPGNEWEFVGSLDTTTGVFTEAEGSQRRIRVERYDGGFNFTFG